MWITLGTNHSAVVRYRQRDSTIRDATRPVDLEVEFLGADPTGLQGEQRIGFSARTSISRRDFGVSFGLAADGSKIVVANKVDISLDVQAFPA